MSTPTSPAYDADDYWGQGVTKLTGYPMPSRKGLFTGLSSKEKSPLFRMSLDKISVQSVVDAAKQGSLKSEGQDYDLYFYSNANGKVEMYHARLVFIGSFMSENGRSRGLDAHESLSGGKYKGKYGDDFDIGPLGQYMGGPGAALDALITSKTTRGTSYNGATVPDADSVDLDSFQQTAQAFDRAAQFFVDQAQTLDGWEKSLGSEQSAWKGQAAGIFWQLVHQLHGNYDNYVQQLGADQKFSPIGDPAYTPKSNHSNHLMQAQQTLLGKARTMWTAWDTWMAQNEHDPHHFLIQTLNEILAWLNQNNIPYISVTTRQTGKESYSTSYSTKPGFQEPHPSYGDLNDIQNWAKVGEEAVRRWNQFIDAPHPELPGLELGLNGTAQQVLSDLNNSWIDAATPFESDLTTKNTNTLTEFYTKEQTEKAKEEADKHSEDFNKTLENLNKGIGDMSKGVTDTLNDLGGGNGPGGLNDLLGNSDSETKDLNGNTDKGPDPNTGKNLAADLTKDLNNNLTNGGGDSTQTGPLNPLVPPPTVSNGSVQGPGGGVTSLDGNGNLVTTYPNGARSVYDPRTGKYTITPAQGRTTVQDLNPGQSVTNPDGSVTRRNKDGTLTTTFEDGSRQTIDPDTGKVTNIDKNGKETVTDLNGSRTGLQWPPDRNTHLTPPPTHSDLNHDLNRNLNRDLNRDLGGDHGGNLHRDLNSLGGTDHSSLNTSSSGGGRTSGGTHTAGGGDYEEYDSTFHPGGTLGAPPGANGSGALGTSGTGASGTGSDPAGTTPLNPMPMGGMGGMGGMGAGGQAGGSSGERVRNVLTESGTGTRGGSGRSGEGRRGTDRERSPRRVRTATTSTPVAGGATGGTQGGQATGSGERDRVHWVAEDEDVWGTEEGGTPTVIGR
ncbi:AAWKG family protein [Streptomyces sp. NPDC093149]|uniref:AAWKG family protein n=1 Tax=Streptomyces sp. NPDC093149 TaxID=3366031 RepID=UPI0038071F43